MKKATQVGVEGVFSGAWSCKTGSEASMLPEASACWMEGVFAVQAEHHRTS